MTWIAGLLLSPFLPLLRKRGGLPPAAFQSYFVGDLFMALPALRLLAAQIPDLRVLCRPDCAELVRAEGLVPLPFNNAFCLKPGRKTFLRTLQAAWNLRGHIGPSLDLDADSRTGLWLKVAGSRRIVSFHRPRAAFFDELYPLPQEARHQCDRALPVVREFLRERSLNGDVSLPAPILMPGAPDASWIVSCWTRLDVKNWPLDRWEALLDRMQEQGIAFRVLEPPDGDADFQAFKARHKTRFPFVRGSLDDIAAEIRSSAGVLGTDNFTGHMGGYFGKPVLWINGSSDPVLVLPRGPLTRLVHYEPMPCRPCIHNCVNPEYKACLNRLDLETVWGAFLSLRAEAEANAS